MTKHEIKKIFTFLLLALSLFAAGCGVKGDPVPPATPAEMGTGKPAYRPESSDESGLLPSGPRRAQPEPDQDETEDED
jgi:hypothetical protein